MTTQVISNMKTNIKSQLYLLTGKAFRWFQRIPNKNKYEQIKKTMIKQRISKRNSCAMAVSLNCRIKLETCEFQVHV